ncbi:C40 family peptidase [Listeria booriae]|uniref:C40 family peptidase n=1 Tax=Listeria booriae TaxID=1552123 RepID=UPI001628EC51|nr:C40 family peptidase [Listeria booriae]MBC2149695.1 C40 family peptidase [Listeria booriae]
MIKNKIGHINRNKKGFYIAILIILAMIAFPTTSLAADYPNEVRNAGVSYEEYTSIMSIPDLKAEPLASPRTLLKASNTQHDAVVNYALKYIGVPYVWGGSSPSGFDCSGLVQYSYKNAIGVSLPRVSKDQGAQGRSVSLNNLQKGDLLFWTNNGVVSGTYHVGMYIGNGQFIQAPKPGDHVKVTNISSYRPHYAKRILPDMATPTPTPTSHHFANLDKVSMDLNTLYVGGWHITDSLQPADPSHRVSNSRFVFVMDASTGRELGRYSIGQVWRQDVANIYSGIRNGGYGGFNLTIPMNSSWYGKQVYFMTRFASDALGNATIDDYYFNTQVYTVPSPTTINTGALDKLQVTEDNLYVGGWHITSKLQPADPSHQVSNSRFIFVMDAGTGRELARYPVAQVWRQDVANVYSNTIHNGGYGGFSVNIPIKQEWSGKQVYVMSRYASDILGNQVIEDYYYISQKVTLTIMK